MLSGIGVVGREIIVKRRISEAFHPIEGTCSRGLGSTGIRRSRRKRERQVAIYLLWLQVLSGRLQRCHLKVALNPAGLIVLWSASLPCNHYFVLCKKAFVKLAFESSNIESIISLFTQKSLMAAELKVMKSSVP